MKTPFLQNTSGRRLLLNLTTRNLKFRYICVYQRHFLVFFRQLDVVGVIFVIKKFDVAVESLFEWLFCNSKVNVFYVIMLGRSEKSLLFKLITQKQLFWNFKVNFFFVIRLKKTDSSLLPSLITPKKFTLELRKIRSKKDFTTTLNPLTLSRRRSLSYRNQSIDLQRISMDLFLYDRDLRHERVHHEDYANCACIKNWK